MQPSMLVKEVDLTLDPTGESNLQGLIRKWAKLGLKSVVVLLGLLLLVQISTDIR